MTRKTEELKDCTLLGNQGVKYPADYAPEMLETFDNKHPEHDYLVTFTCPEFTSLCPKTGQPDFGKILINYIPDRKMVESKSLKLYLFSFRKHNTQGSCSADASSLYRSEGHIHATRRNIDLAVCQLWRRRASGSGACPSCTVNP